jgi:putative ABC transport system permease protein
MTTFRFLGTAISLAVDSIRVHKLRSFLTLLGIIIGVASVILVGAAIDGLGAYADQITSKAFGTNSFLVAQIASVGRLTYKQIVAKQKRNKRIRPEDVAYLRSVTGTQVLYASYQQRIADVKAENQTYEDANIIGASATLPDIRDVPVADGRFFTETEEQYRQPVAVIGEDIRTKLFPGSSPIGRTLRLTGIDFTVVGLLEQQGSSFGQSLDNPVYIPISVYYQLFGGRDKGIMFGRGRPSTGLTMDGALDITRNALRSHFHARPGEEDNFDVLTPDSVRSFTDQILGVIAGVVVPITAISLVVGGIVVMNIMLVSVTERTREIGIRKSLGARESDIMLQFLTESVFLSIAGGVLGLIVGASIAQLLQVLTGATLRVTATYVVLSILVSSIVGIVSGWYPARRAARLDPVEALRAE